MLEQVFVKLLEGTAIIAIQHVSQWLADAMFWTATTGMSPTDMNGTYCEHYTKERAILEQSMGCDHQLTECTLLHIDDQLWFSCTAVNCSDDSWNIKGQCFEATVQETSTKNVQSCHSSTRINRDMDDTLKTCASGISGIYIGQDDCMEMLIEGQGACSLSLPISDCTYDQFGKLVRMTIKFDDFDSGASWSSSGNESSSDDESYKSDCEEDFIIFDSDSDLDACHITSSCCDTCSSANSTHVSGEFCWEGKTNFKQNLADFVEGINQCHPSYNYRQCELNFPGKEALKGIQLSNNNVPVIVASANEICKGEPKESPKSSHCKTQDAFLHHCERKAETEEKPEKCVQFKQEPELVTVHSIVAWDFAYRQARVGPWERAAVDRLRFQKRIQELEKVLGPVLLGLKLKSDILYHETTKDYL